MQSASLLMHMNEVLFTEIIKNNNKKKVTLLVLLCLAIALSECRHIFTVILVIFFSSIP